MFSVLPYKFIRVCIVYGSLFNISCGAFIIFQEMEADIEEKDKRIKVCI